MNNVKVDWNHDHNYLEHNARNWRSVSIVFWLTTLVMVIEITAGLWTGSMALLADGWHMGTHSAAFAITLFAYVYANKHSGNRQFSFGTGKVNYLGSFASAIALGVVALMMMIESVQRFFAPENIHFDEAIYVAIVGLIVNIASVLLLHDHSQHHTPDHSHEHEQKHEHSDHNLKAAYFHVLADTLTSFLAIIALFAGKHLGWIWMDALMGIVGAVIITKWSYNLIKESSTVLLDKSPDYVNYDEVAQQLMSAFQVTITDLHVWHLSSHHQAGIISVKGGSTKDIKEYKTYMAEHYPKLTHLTIEIVS